MILEVHLRTWYHESRISRTGEHASFLSLAGSVVQHSFVLLKTSCLALNWGKLRCYPQAQDSHQRALSLTGSFCRGHLRPVHSAAIVPSPRVLWAELWLLKPGVESSPFFLPEFRFQWNKFLSILILLADTDLAGVCDSYVCYFWGWMLRYLSGRRSYVQSRSWGTQCELDSDAGFLGVWLRKSIWPLWTGALFSLDKGSLGAITKAP